jgi:AraC family transcriptional regulator
MHRRLRLERAASRLRDGDASVTAIAFEAGYETHEAFTRAFRGAYGASPSAFRQSAADPERALPLQIHVAAPSGVHFGLTAADPPIRFAEGDKPMNVTVEDMPELRVAAVRHVGPYNRISEAFARHGAIAGPGGLLREGAMMLAIYYDDPETTAAEQLQSDAGLSVSEDTKLPDGVVEERLPAGRYARTTHVGSYETLGDTWARFMGEWLPRSGERVGPGSAYEVYRNNPSNARPDELRTDLYLPLA